MERSLCAKNTMNHKTQHHPYFFLFFGIFFVLYTFINVYIFIHGYRMLDVFGIPPGIYTILFIFFAFAYIVGEFIQQKKSTLFSDGLITIWSLWFVGIVHFFFVSLAYDILKIIQYLTQWIQTSRMQIIAFHTTWISVLGTLLTIVIWYLNARTPAIHKHTIALAKRNTLHPELTLAVVSDIHLWPTNGIHHIERIVKKVNALSPDMILLVGDIVDGELDPVIRRDIGNYLRKFQARYGIYGVNGNHEYIWGISRAHKYLKDHNITILDDSICKVAGIQLIGRRDISCLRFGQKRKNLGEMLTKWSEETVIVMDHQPKQLSEAEENNVDIQFSGHTHNGQLWPINFIVKKIFEVPKGYKKKWNTHIFVSPGVGTWWPPVRTNARPEILFVQVLFENPL